SPHGRAGTSMRQSANAFAKQRRASFSACMRGISRATRSGRQSSRRGGRFGGKSRSRLLGNRAVEKRFAAEHFRRRRRSCLHTVEMVLSEKLGVRADGE